MAGYTCCENPRIHMTVYGKAKGGFVGVVPNSRHGHVCWNRGGPLPPVWLRIATLEAVCGGVEDT